MSGINVRRGGREHLEQSDIRLTINVVQTANGGLLHARLQECQFVIREPPAKVTEHRNLGVEFPRNEIERSETK